MDEPDRAAYLAALLARYGWTDATRVDLPVDASFRRYARLTRGGETRDPTALLMDAPPDREKLGPYLAVARHLVTLGFSAPRILGVDEPAGYALIEDFGDGTFTRLLAAGADETALYAMGVDTLAALHKQSRATAIALPAYDTELLVAEASLFVDWYLPANSDRPLPGDALHTWQAAWRKVLDALPPTPPALVLRDFHVDNLMRLDGRDGVRRCGLLDFQDALIGPAAYDLASLLEDARRDIDPAVGRTMRARYTAAMGGTDRSFALWYDVLAAQRHAKVAGIFTRLDRRDGKPIYLKHIPRVMRLLHGALGRQHALAPVAEWLRQTARV